MVTPATEFQDVYSFLSSPDSNGEGKNYHERPKDGGPGSRFYAYASGVIFEVIPNSQDN
jgi:hypothetical protein